MEDLAGGPMLRPPGIAPEGTRGNKEPSEQGTPSPCAGRRALPFAQVHELSDLVWPAPSGGSDYFR